MEEFRNLFAYLEELYDKYYAEGKRPPIMEADRVWVGVMTRYEKIRLISRASVSKSGVDSSEVEEGGKDAHGGAE